MSKELKLKDAKEVMPAETAEMFAEIRENPLLKPFILIGGTALSLHIGHRISEDLDFVTLQPKLPRAALKQLERELTNKGHQLRQEISPEDYDDFQNAGLELEDSSQTWVVDNSVKMTFFTAEPHHAKLLAPATPGDFEQRVYCGFKIATFQEVSQLKAIVTASRSKGRDWLDLFILEKDHQFGVAQWKEAFDQAGLTPMHFEIALNRMCNGNLAIEDENYTTLLPNPPTIEAMQARFRTLRREYETAMAKRLIKKKPETGMEMQ